ncbi:hypothetical protein K2X85_03865 [bacterium]|jgi:hypothetical protein|nr:hypothetical protein [bacterium]
MIGSAMLMILLWSGDDPPATIPPGSSPEPPTANAATQEPPSNQGKTLEPKPAGRPRKKLGKGDRPTAEAKPIAPDDQAPAPESDRPIPKPDELPADGSLTDEKLDEDLGQELEAASNPDQDPLGRVAEGMKQAEEKLAQRQSADETIGLQEKIIKDLDELLQQAENPPPPGGGGKQSKKKPNPGQKQQQGQQKTASQKSKAPRSSDSNERIGPPGSVREELKPQTGDRNVWGHLSEMMREEMGQYAKENFLGKYRDLIERYYTDIARQSSQK